MTVDPTLALSTTVAAGQAGHAALHNAERARLNQLVPSYGRLAMRLAYEGIRSPLPLVVIRHDDGPSNDLTAAGYLLSRGLPAGFALVENNLNASGKLSTADCLTLQAQGFEMMAHSRDHLATPPPASDLYDNIVGSANRMRALGLHIDSFVRPGGWTGLFESMSDYDTPLGQAVQAEFIASESYVADAHKSGVRSFPAVTRHGANQTSATTLAALTPLLAMTIANHGILEMLVHTGGMTAGSWTEYQSMLDAIVTERDAGRVLVVTPTGALLAQRGDRINLCPDPSFEGFAVDPAQSAWKASGAVTFTPGRTGGQAARVGTGIAAKLDYTAGMVQTHRTLEVSGWARAVSGSATARIGSDMTAGSALANGSYTKTQTVTDAAWTRVTRYVRMDPRATVGAVTFGATGALDWDDITIHKV